MIRESDWFYVIREPSYDLNRSDWASRTKQKLISPSSSLIFSSEREGLIAGAD